MNLTIERGALLKGLAHVQGVVERRNTIPILANVKLEATDNGLGVTATDMDLTIVEKSPATVGTAGAVTAPAHTLYDIVRKLPEGAQIEIAHGGEEGLLTLTAGRSKFRLSCLPVEDFPILGEDGLPHSFTLAAAELKRLIDRTSFAISTEETRYYLNGIYLHQAASEGVAVLRAVATDGHRLARIEMPLPEGADGIPGVIVPRKPIAELRKLIDEVGGDVAVSLSESRIRFTFDDVVLTSKLIDGTFPDYARVIPTDNDKTLDVDRRSFAAAIDRVSAISAEKSRAIKLGVDRDSLVLSATSPENGSATEEIEVSYSASGIEIGFNSRYLLDITQQIEGEHAQLVMADSASPTLVRDTADANALYVLMPMRV